MMIYKNINNNSDIREINIQKNILINKKKRLVSQIFSIFILNEL